MPTAPINGIQLYFETHGDGFPLVYVHGGFGGLGTGQGAEVPAWVERFARDFTVILYDRRSSGRSEYPLTPHSMGQFADDIHRLLAHLGHDRAHIWGTSAGGPITLEYAFRHPRAAASLVVTDSAPWLSQDRALLAALKERIRILETDGEAAAYEARRLHGTVGINLFAPTSASRSASPKERETSANRSSGADAIRAQLAAIPREERIAKYAGELRTYSAYADWNGSSRFRDLKMPVLILYGTGDTVFPEVDWPRLAAGRDHVTCRLYPGAEHGLTGRIPESIDTIHGFLRGHSGD